MRIDPIPLKIMSVAVLTLILAACQFSDEHKMKVKYGVKPADVEIANDKYIDAINFLPGENPNQYTMQLSLTV